MVKAPPVCHPSPCHVTKCLYLVAHLIYFWTEFWRLHCVYTTAAPTLQLPLPLPLQSPFFKFTSCSLWWSSKFFPSLILCCSFPQSRHPHCPPRVLLCSVVSCLGQCVSGFFESPKAIFQFMSVLRPLLRNINRPL